MTDQPAKSTWGIRIGWLAGGVTLSCLLSASWWLLLTSPVLRSCEQARLMLEDADNLTAIGEPMQQRLVTAQTECDHWTAEVKRQRPRLMANGSDAEFLNWIHQAASRCQLSIGDFRPAGRHVIGDYEGSTISVSANGTYTNICRFLSALRTCPQMNRITSLELRPIDNSADMGLSLHVALYTKVSK